jgi:hypothetical protein
MSVDVCIPPGLKYFDPERLMSDFYQHSDTLVIGSVDHCVVSVNDNCSVLCDAVILVGSRYSTNCIPVVCI